MKKINTFLLSALTVVCFILTATNAVMAQGGGGPKKDKPFPGFDGKDSRVPKGDGQYIAPTYKVGDKYDGGIVIVTDKRGLHGLVVTEEDAGPMTWDEAMQYCKDLERNHRGTWYLPSLNEWSLIYYNLYIYSNPIGLEGNYWTSFEDPQFETHAFRLGFPRGHTTTSKNRRYLVRAVRAF